ncbi:ATP-binding cassette domain-containing protein [Pseudomonas guariconensis]|uniref:ATP-binding cassette domain-containing protein n=1 Tax=Pseudomonas TaxID=286 RepID=UPI002096FDA0|nr:MULTISPECIES: ATP-binding cassette domain-containing protein [Pseudomonas]MCO7636971.1 ATP-binding cassette domain-containing protein [Pseudomonas sp. S 311-6]MCO7516905.1 ATP-binding cassette domain-containing protein [Pseudomonas putida]MCO7564887.1 ATP-binding cassette domain-containing protein [Pseudomonas mosselii]MCO7594844.1 ATP-binding cassette domain-containing protein [Pseudomonas guariconensis]MCO7607348.1 ATP-binding cassette domain-containing protein [Pseudomonas guariconensis]
MSILSIKNLSFSYKNQTLFDNIGLALNKGEIVGILGSNGAGKTTLFDLICKIRKPTHGKIINNSQQQLYLTQILTPPPLLHMAEVYNLISCLSSTSTPSHSETLARLYTWSPPLFKRYSEISKKKASTCSYGEIRSFFTLTLLLMGSDLIILDEPTAGVDPEFRHYIWLGISNACQEGAAVLISSHYTHEIATHCHRFYMLARQRLEEFDSGDQFMTRHHATSLDEAFINATV